MVSVVFIWGWLVIVMHGQFMYSLSLSLSLCMVCLFVCGKLIML